MRTINVIDMYHGNAINLNRFAELRNNGIMGIIHKSSQGLHFADAAYSDRKKAAQDAGLLFGAYHFIDGSDPVAQAEFFLKSSGALTDGGENLSLWVDFENTPHQAALHQVQTFMSEVDRAAPAGVACGIYSGNLIRETLKPSAGGHIAPDMFSVVSFFQNHRLWLAEYGPHQNIPYPWNSPILKSSDQSTPLPAPGVFLWQFTEKGRVNPLTGNTDGNFFDGAFELLKARWTA